MVRKKSAIFATPEDAEAAFYDALEEADVESLMAAWAEDEEIVCVHPGGPRLVGHAMVRSAWQQILGNGALRVRVATLHAQHAMMVAVHNVIEEIAVSTAEGDQIAHVVATNVYFKGPTGWRLVLHHASAAADGEVPIAAPPDASLH